MTGGSSGSLPVCVRLAYKGKSYECVLDTGAERSMVPPDMLVNEAIRATTDKLYAINGTPLKVIGEADILMGVRGRALKTRVYVIDGIKKPTLGLEWLRCHRALWNFEADTVIIAGMEIPLVGGGWEEPSEAIGGAKGQNTRKIVDAALCAVDSSSSGGQQPTCAEAADTGQSVAGKREENDRLKSQRGGSGKIHMELGRRGCYRCGRLEHQVRECPCDPPAGDRRDSGSENGGRHRRRTCFVCGDGGHIARACPNRQSGGAAEKDRSKKGLESTPEEIQPVVQAGGTSENVEFETELVVRRKRCFHCDQEGHMMRSCPDRTSQETVSQQVEEPNESQASEENAESGAPVAPARGRGLARWSSRGSWIAGAMLAKRWQLLGLNGEGQGQE